MRRAQCQCETALPQKSKNAFIWQWGFSLMPQRGYGLQPRVAASATLGTSKKRNFNRNAVASFSQKEMHHADATALRLRTRSLSLLREATAHGLVSFTRPKGIALPPTTLSMSHAQESVLLSYANVFLNETLPLPSRKTNGISSPTRIACPKPSGTSPPPPVESSHKQAYSCGRRPEP